MSNGKRIESIKVRYSKDKVYVYAAMSPSRFVLVCVNRFFKVFNFFDRLL